MHFLTLDTIQQDYIDSLFMTATETFLTMTNTLNTLKKSLKLKLILGLNEEL